MRALHDELLSYGEPGEPAEPTDVARPIQLTQHGADLTFVSTITTFDVVLAEVAIETCLPADDLTTAFLLAHPPNPV